MRNKFVQIFLFDIYAVKTALCVLNGFAINQNQTAHHAFVLAKHLALFHLMESAFIHILIRTLDFAPEFREIQSIGTIFTSIGLLLKEQLISSKILSVWIF